MASVLKVDTIKSLTGNEAITISESGVPQLNVPAFRAGLSSNQSVTSATNTIVDLDTVSQDKTFDTHGWFDTVNHRYTPQTAGYYWINGVLRTTGTNISRTLVYLYVNGVSFIQGTSNNPVSSASPQVLLVSSVMYLNGSTDYVQLLGQVTATSPVFASGNSSGCFLEGFLVRAA